MPRSQGTTQLNEQLRRSHAHSMRVTGRAASPFYCRRSGITTARLRRRRIELRVLLLDPALMILGILDRYRGLGHVQRAKRIHHYG